MDSKTLKSLAKTLRRTADRDGDLRPSSFSKQLDRAFGVSDPLKRQEQIYVSTIAFAMAFATELANSAFAKQLRQRLESGIDEYMPGYPPMSPVTDSHFYCSTYTFSQASPIVRKRCLTMMHLRSLQERVPNGRTHRLRAVISISVRL